MGTPNWIDRRVSSEKYHLHRDLNDEKGGHVKNGEKGIPDRKRKKKSANASRRGRAWYVLLTQGRLVWMEDGAERRPRHEFTETTGTW